MLLRLPDVFLAESEGNDVWLSTDQGRRIREIERGLEGELFPVMGDRTNDMVPISRLNAPVVRRAPRHNLCSRKDSRV
ncbi:MAG: sigma-54 dependent transcriptional regulator, acetoin dehydrogenase operon transcriptional [Pseudonocardiales bacterium]|nr:sigma-54 dependent transcriptional regulator, acetoin dehydrogenase operon transcriptional [Pseudonocardiales bacterium]